MQSLQDLNGMNVVCPADKRVIKDFRLRNMISQGGYKALTQYTPWVEGNRSDIVDWAAELSFHTVECKLNNKHGIISEFGFERLPTNKSRYSYKCCYLQQADTAACNHMSTAATDAGSLSILDSHRLTCGNNEYLSKFVFYKNGAGKISYEYSCCGMTNSPTSSPTGAPSPAPGTPTFMPTLEPTFDPTFMPTINGTNSTLLGAVEGGSILVGVIFSMLAAMTLALSMNIQSYALSAPLDEGIYAACSCLNRNRLWTIGLLFYASANGFYVVGLGFAPLSLMSALFATVLVFNAIFANRFLGEEVRTTDVLGLVIILGSVSVCGVFGPTSNKDISADDIWQLCLASSGILFWSASISCLLILIIKVNRFETNYPAFGNPDADNMVEDGTGRLDKSGERKPYVLREPGREEVLLMMVIYPLILAIFESLGQVGMKAVSCMLKLHGEGKDQLSTTTFWVCLFLLCVDGYLIILWLAKVYGKFETTDCLPIEYGIVTVVSVSSGIIFFQEYKEVASVNLIVMAASMVGCCFGIYVATMSKRAVDEEDKPMAEGADTDGRRKTMTEGRRRHSSVADKYLRRTGGGARTGGKEGGRRRQTVRSLSIFPPPHPEDENMPRERDSNTSPQGRVRRGASGPNSGSESDDESMPRNPTITDGRRSAKPDIYKREPPPQSAHPLALTNKQPAADATNPFPNPNPNPSLSTAFQPPGSGPEDFASRSEPVPNNQLQEILAKSQRQQTGNGYPLGLQKKGQGQASRNNGNQEQHGHGAAGPGGLVLNSPGPPVPAPGVVPVLDQQGSQGSQGPQGGSNAHMLKQKELELREQELELRHRELQHRERERDFAEMQRGGGGGGGGNGGGAGAGLSHESPQQQQAEQAYGAHAHRSEASSKFRAAAHATGAAQKNWGSSGGWDDAYTLEYLSSPRGHNPLRVYYQRAGGDEAFHTIHLDGATGSDISVESIKEQMTLVTNREMAPEMCSRQEVYLIMPGAGDGASEWRQLHGALDHQLVEHIDKHKAKAKAKRPFCDGLGGLNSISIAL
eukprot:g1146.t1